MTLTSHRGVILGLLLTTLVLHLAVAWQDFAVLAKNGFLYDDSFYAFKIAANIAQGQGMTFDGVTPTNGFQPLYVFLLVPLFWVSGSDLVAPVYGALSLAAILTAFSTVLLYQLLRRYVSKQTSVLVSVLWAFSPVVIKQSANGLETALALFLFAASVLFYVSRIRSAARPSRKDFLIMGTLLGLAVLARIDEVFVALAILLDYLVVLKKRNAGVRALVDVAAAIGMAIVVYGPWLLISMSGAGRFFQDSGAATRFLSIAYAPLFNLGSADMLANGPNAGFIWGHFLHALAVLKVAPPVHVFFRVVERIGMGLGAGPTFQLIANVTGLILVGGLLYAVVRPGRGGTAAAISELRFLLVVAVVLVAAYSFYVFGVFFFIRYLYPVYFVACVYAAFLIEMLFKRLGRQAKLARAVVALGLTLYAGGFAYMTYTSAFRTQPVYFFYDAAHWVSDNTEVDEKIGVFQGGAIGYLSNRNVINLDGKVNRYALDALKNHQLCAFLEQEGVNVILDNSNVLDLFLFEPDNGGLRGTVTLEKIMHGAKDGIPGWAAYRISGWGEGAAGSPTAPRAATGD